MLTARRLQALRSFCEGYAPKYYQGNQDAERAADPNTSFDDLVTLSRDYPALVQDNPVLPLFALEDPQRYQSLVAHIQRGFYRAKGAEKNKSSRKLNMHLWMEPQINKWAHQWTEAYTEWLDNESPAGLADWPDEWDEREGWGVVKDGDEQIWSANFQKQFGNKPGKTTINAFFGKVAGRFRELVADMKDYERRQEAKGIFGGDNNLYDEEF